MKYIEKPFIKIYSRLVIPYNDCYLDQIFNNETLSTFKVYKIIKAFLFSPKIEKVFPNALSSQYTLYKYILYIKQMC